MITHTMDDAEALDALPVGAIVRKSNKTDPAMGFQKFDNGRWYSPVTPDPGISSESLLEDAVMVEVLHPRIEPPSVITIEPPATHDVVNIEVQSAEASEGQGNLELVEDLAMQYGDEWETVVEGFMIEYWDEPAAPELVDWDAVHEQLETSGYVRMMHYHAPGHESFAVIQLMLERGTDDATPDTDEG